MKESPEYFLAKALISHLRHNEQLTLEGKLEIEVQVSENKTIRETVAGMVFPEPWDSMDQCQNLSLAAGQYGLALAVSPQAPGYISEEKMAAGYLEARLAVSVVSTSQVHGGKAASRVANLAGLVIAALARWDYQENGIPYAAPRIYDIQEMEVDKFPGFENLSMLTIFVAKIVNYKTYYANN